MTYSRASQVDFKNPGVYHLVSRCVRRAFLLEEGVTSEHRREWIQLRLEHLARHMAIDVAAFAVMSNHLHVVVWTDPDRPKSWSPEEVARRWLVCGRGEKMPADRLQDEIAELAEYADRIEVLRERLASVSWFMKLTKEKIAKLANAQDGVKGHFWEARFKSYRLLDMAAVLACCVYVDLNPVRSGVAALPEKSTFVSLRSRLDACFAEVEAATQRRLKNRERGGQRSRRARQASRDAQAAAIESPWLVSFEAPAPEHTGEAERRSLFGIGFQGYLKLVDAMSRNRRSGKEGVVAANAAPILKRIGINVDAWTERVFAASMKVIDDWWGTAIGDKLALATEAARRGQSRVVDPIRRLKR